MSTLTDIKSNFKMYVDHDISDEVLTIHYMINEEPELAEFPYSQFEEWIKAEHCEENDGEWVIWTTYNDQYKGEQSYSKPLWDFIQENEKDLVTAFFNKVK